MKAIFRKGRIIINFKTWYAPKYFIIDEFVCKCGCGLGKDDALPAVIVMALDVIRDRINMPLIINSGWRCVKHNAASGGVKTSKHLSGHAVDISASDYHKLLQESSKIAKEFGMKIIPYHYLKFAHMEIRIRA